MRRASGLFACLWLSACLTLCPPGAAFLSTDPPTSTAPLSPSGGHYHAASTPPTADQRWHFSHDLPPGVLEGLQASVTVKRWAQPAEYYLAFTVLQSNGSCPLLLMDSAGRLVASKQHSQCGWVPVVVNETHLLFSVHPRGDTWQKVTPGEDIRPFLWDLQRNTVAPVPVPNNGRPYHHELVYNPHSQSFIAMQQRAVPAGSSRVAPIYHEELLEYDLQGRLRWRWFSADHLNVSRAAITCMDMGGARLLDLALHGNSLDWHPGSDVVVFTARNVDTFYAIDRGTGAIRFSVGRLGSYRTRAFTHPHNVHQSGPQRYLLFDNDERCNVRQSKRRSRFMELELKQSGKVGVIWTGAEQADLFTPYGGSCQRLPGGHAVGVFSSRATFVEVDRRGRVVQTIRLRRAGLPLGNVLFAQAIQPEALAGTPGSLRR